MIISKNVNYTSIWVTGHMKADNILIVYMFSIDFVVLVYLKNRVTEKKRERERDRDL